MRLRKMTDASLGREIHRRIRHLEKALDEASRRKIVVHLMIGGIRLINLDAEIQEPEEKSKIKKQAIYARGGPLFGPPRDI